jgi:uncharacterized protein YozE (UPF0346 family)
MQAILCGVGFTKISLPKKTQDYAIILSVISLHQSPYHGLTLYYSHIKYIQTTVQWISNTVYYITYLFL